MIGESRVDRVENQLRRVPVQRVLRLPQWRGSANMRQKIDTSTLRDLVQHRLQSTNLERANQSNLFLAWGTSTQRPLQNSHRQLRVLFRLNPNEVQQRLNLCSFDQASRSILDSHSDLTQCLECASIGQAKKSRIAVQARCQKQLLSSPHQVISLGQQPQGIDAQKSVGPDRTKQAMHRALARVFRASQQLIVQGMQRVRRLGALHREPHPSLHVDPAQSQRSSQVSGRWHEGHHPNLSQALEDSSSMHAEMQVHRVQQAQACPHAHVRGRVGQVIDIH